jgi:hypothetical protein
MTCKECGQVIKLTRTYAPANDIDVIRSFGKGQSFFKRAKLRSCALKAALLP